MSITLMGTVTPTGPQRKARTMTTDDTTTSSTDSKPTRKPTRKPSKRKPMTAEAKLTAKLKRAEAKAAKLAVPVIGVATFGQLIDYVMARCQPFRLRADRRGHGGGWYHLSRMLRILKMVRVHTSSADCPVNVALLSDSKAASKWAESVLQLTSDGKLESDRPNPEDLADVAQRITRAAQTIRSDDVRSIVATAYVLGTPLGLCSVPAVRDMVLPESAYYPASDVHGGAAQALKALASS